MKHFTLLSFYLLFAFAINAQQIEINWMSIEEAQAAQKKEPRKILVDVYTKWCGPCKMMMKNTFTNADVIQYINENYYAVKFDAESPDEVTFKELSFSNPDYVPNKAGRNGVHQLSRYWSVRAYPTIVYIDEDLNILAPISGYKTPKQLELHLKFFAEDGHKNVKTQEQWQEYQASFKPEFN